MSEQTASFEQAIQELEKIVTEMESGEISLEQSLEKFERGIKLVRSSQALLNQAEQKVQILLSDDSNASLEAYRSEESD